MQYRREIDGLRAIAVLPVIFFHAGLGLFAGGYVGVDVFFVISGYLITTIIINDLNKGRFSIKQFYERRARRIAPALFFVLACCIPIAWMVMLPSQFKDFSHSLLAISFFVSNILFWRNTNYFAPSAEENPLLHTWTLAVEEQFYLFFPILLLLLWRFGRNPVFYTVVGLTCASFLLSEWGWRNASAANFFLLPTRAWELGVGAICAFLLANGFRRQSPLLANAGLVLILYSIFFYDADTPFPSFYALAPVGGAALIILFGNSSTTVARILSTPLLVGIGLISYSAYLWHQPLLAFARIGSITYPAPLTLGLLGMASLGLAYLTWRYIEQPFRKKPVPVFPTQNAVFGATVAGTAALILVGLYGHVSDGRFNSWVRQNPEWAETYFFIEETVALKRAGHPEKNCRFKTKELAGQTVTRLLECRETYGPGMAIVGDSHGIDFYNGMNAEYPGEFLVGITSGGCRPHTKAEDCAYGETASFIERYPEVFEAVIYTQAGFHLLETVDGATGREILSHVPETASMDPAYYEENPEYIASVAAYLERIARYTRVVWVGPRIEPHIGKRYLLANGCDYEYQLRPGLDQVFRKLDEKIATHATRTQVPYISQIAITDFNMDHDFMDCTAWHWSDGDHWSLSGASMFVARMLNDAQFSAAIGLNSVSEGVARSK